MRESRTEGRLRETPMYPRADRKRGDPPACDMTVVADKISGRLFTVARETREHRGFLSRRRVGIIHDGNPVSSCDRMTGIERRERRNRKTV